LLIRFALLDHSVELEDLLRSLSGSGGGGGGSGGGGAAPAPPFVRPEPRPAARAEDSGRREDAGQYGRPSLRPPSARPSSVQPAHPAPSATARGLEALDVNTLTGRWDALVERMRASGKPMLATALEHASPVAVTASGVITIELDESNDIYAHAITSARGDLVTALREWFSGVERLDLRRDDQTPAAPPKRLTDEMVRAERIAALRKRDPVLSAAIDALDLDVAD
jgi:hypothetical protein